VNFRCEKCGSCCRAAGCKNLQGDLCSIYEARPPECRVAEGYFHFGFNDTMDWEEYEWHNKRICNKLREIYG